MLCDLIHHISIVMTTVNKPAASVAACFNSLLGYHEAILSVKVTLIHLMARLLAVKLYFSSEHTLCLRSPFSGSLSAVREK